MTTGRKRADGSFYLVVDVLDEGERERPVRRFLTERQATAFARARSSSERKIVEVYFVKPDPTPLASNRKGPDRRKHVYSFSWY